MAVRIQVQADTVAGPIPPIWRPSAMQGNGIAPALDQYAAIPGPHGLTRLAAPFGAYDMTEATSLSDYLARCTLYLNLPEVQEALTRGPCVFEITGCPLFLSSISDATVLGGSGWKAYRAAKPADLTAGGTWQTAMQSIVNLVMNTYALPAPRHPTTGAFDLTRPGVFFEFWNEPNHEVFFGFNGTGTFGDWLLAYRRFVAGAKAANPLVAFGAPVVAGYNEPRTDLLYATTSADILSGGRSAGGTEGTGRFLGQGLRSYFRFDVSTLADAAIGSAVLKTTNITPNGTISADSWAYRPYNTNGQGDPATDSDATAFTRCGSGSPYLSGDTAWRTTGAKALELTATAGADIRAAIPSGKYTVAVTMTAESSGADRYANPLGFDDALQSNRAQLQVTYTKTFMEVFCDYAGANSIAPDVIHLHNFQTYPAEAVAEGAALIASALATAGLPAITPIVLTEYQNFDLTQVGVRDDYRSASYVLSTVHDHWSAGYSAMCQVLLKLGTAPTVANLFTDEWGLILKGTTSGYWVACPSFMALRLFSLWANGARLSFSQSGDSGVRSFAALAGDSIIVVASRWDPGATSIPLEVALRAPLGIPDHTEVTRFDPTTNNPKYTYQSTPGTDTQRAAAAMAASAAATHITFPGSASLSLTLGAQDSLFAQFFLRQPTPDPTPQNRPRRYSRNMRLY